MTISRRLAVEVLVGALIASAVVVLVLALSPPSTEGPEIPDLYRYVNDLSDPSALSSEEVAVLDAACGDLDDGTTAEVAVLIVDTTAPMGIDEFAFRTFERNGIGKAGKDNGILLVISVDERLWRIEVGYGVEPVLTDARVGRIGRDILAPNLTSGDYFAGIQGTVVAIGDHIRAEYDPGAPPRQDPWASVCAPSFLVFLVTAFVLFAAWSLYVHRHPEVAAWYRGPSTGGGGSTESHAMGRTQFGGSGPRGGFGGGRSGGGGARGRF